MGPDEEAKADDARRALRRRRHLQMALGAVLTAVSLLVAVVMLANAGSDAPPDLVVRSGGRTISLDSYSYDWCKVECTGVVTDVSYEEELVVSPGAAIEVESPTAGSVGLWATSVGSGGLVPADGRYLAPDEPGRYEVAFVHQGEDGDAGYGLTVVVEEPKGQDAEVEVSAS